jgi:hypothetical protein
MPQMVSLSEAARECFREGVDEIRSEMELPSFSERLSWVWSKLEAHLARFSLIVGICRVVESGPGTPERIDADDVLRASALLGYFKSHARRVYARLYGEDRGERLAEDLARFLHRLGGIWSGGHGDRFLRRAGERLQAGARQAGPTRANRIGP